MASVLSQQCQKGNHDSCTLQITVDNEQTNCQCACHPGGVNVNDETERRTREITEEQERASKETRDFKPHVS